jgi:predicted Zn-dependent protease
MRSIIALLATLSAGYSCACLAQAATPPGPYSNEALIWEHYDTTVHMHADGTGERLVHIAARLQSQGAVSQLTVVSVFFAAANETGNIDYVRVHKPDGTTVETPVDGAIEMPASVTRTAPLYSDLKEKQLPVRSLAIGDVLEYQMRTVITKAQAPGHFWGAEHFLRDAGVVLSQTLTLELPAEAYVQVWNPNHPTTPTQHDGLRTYTWSVSQLQPTGKPGNTAPAEKINDPDEDGDGRKLPSVAWTTFHSWQEVGAWYRGLALDRAQATPAIVSKANELTRAAQTPEEQVRALYNFVSTRIHYVGIDFGIGRLQPHAAEEVLAYQYGDCKDKDTLFEALLRAKGFAPAPALIGVGIAPVPDLPSPALFNHVITTVSLAGKPVWLDTTPGFAPFQVLVAPIRDQQALVIPATAAANLVRTPAQPPYPYFERFEAVASLDKDGLLTSHMEITLRSDNELGFRALLQQIAPAQWDEAAQGISRALGFGGTVTHSDLTQKDPAGPVHVHYDYTRPSFADWEHHRILPLFPVLEITFIDRDKAPDRDIDQGAPRTLEAVTHIRLPQSWEATLPEAVHVARRYATFDQTYRKDKDELIIERKVVILQSKIAKADWKDYYAYTKALGAESGESYITLLAPGEATGATALVKARQEFMQGKWEDAQRTLNELKASNPNEPYLMSMLGFLAQRDHKPEEAARDYEAELANHPDANIAIVKQLVVFYIDQKRFADAEIMLRKFMARDPVALSRQLAYVQTRAGDNAAALETLQTALAAHPGEPTLQAMLPPALHRCHRDQEAVALIKQALTRSDAPSNDANTLNTNAYLLAQMQLELPLAEASSRRAVDLLETASAAVRLQQVNDTHYAQTNLLAAAWDTLGWILFEEGKPAEASPYLQAAWRVQTNAIVGDHLAQVLEALGKPAEALTIDELASAAGEGDDEATADLAKNAHRLRQAGIHSETRDATQSLQQMRTFRVAKPASLAGSATVQLAIAADRVQESNLLQGSESMRALAAKINGLSMAGAVPKGSRAHLFRDAILFCSNGPATCEFVLSPHQFGQTSNKKEVRAGAANAPE